MLPVGIVVMGKLKATGEKVAIKYHNSEDSRNSSYDILSSFAQGSEARQYIACIPMGLEPHQAKFDDYDKFPPAHNWALVLEGGDQTLAVRRGGTPPEQPHTTPA
jgi:hypothetical protein